MICRYLNDSRHIKYQKIASKPPLTITHKNNRLEYARCHTGWGKEWNNIIFSDKKKFNLDGPDGFRYYWHDLRMEKMILSKRVQGGGFVMIWCAFIWEGKTTVEFIDGPMDSLLYQNLLQRSLLPFG